MVGAPQGRQFKAGTPEFGMAFETYLMHELLSFRDYVAGQPLSCWRSTSGFEVDFIIGDHTAIEVRAKENVSAQDLKSLRAIAEEKRLKRYLCAIISPRRRAAEGMTILPYKEFLAPIAEATEVRRVLKSYLITSRKRPLSDDAR